MLIRTTRTLSTWALRALFYAVLFGVVVIAHLGISGALRAQGWGSGTLTADRLTGREQGDEHAHEDGERNARANGHGGEDHGTGASQRSAVSETIVRATPAHGRLVSAVERGSVQAPGRTPWLTADC